MANPSDILPNTPVYDPSAHYQRVMALYNSYPIKTAEVAERHAFTIIARGFKTVAKDIDSVSEDFARALLATIEQIFEVDKFHWLTPPERWGLAENERLLAPERLEAATDGAVKLVSMFLQILPEEAFSFKDDQDNQGIPLIELVENPADLVEGICQAFAQITVPNSKAESPAFPETRESNHQKHPRGERFVRG